MFGNAMIKNENTKPTKELILDAAFSFLEKPGFTSFSMNELAAKVGISKPAIYRHFKNKDAVLEEMENRIVDNMAFFLRNVSSQDEIASKKSLADLIDYFGANPSHINYFIAQMSSIPNYEEHLFDRLYECDVPFLAAESRKAYLENFRNDMQKFSRHVFCGMTIFFFVSLQERFLKLGKISKPSKNFGDNVVNLMLEGLIGTTCKNDAFYPEPVSEERKKELMKENKMEGLMFKMDNDPRITKVGKVIRKLSIDELPQFFNVLRGDMSLIGTRPPTIDEFKQYESRHKRRLSMRPGITGLWQVSGRSNIQDFEEVVRLDCKYIDEWSIWLDILILFKTVPVVLTHKGAE